MRLRATKRRKGAMKRLPRASDAVRTTAHAKKVYAMCMRVPRGRVTTYAAIAKVLGTCPRAVGSALRRNPHAPRVPCHRVVAASLQLGGFRGRWGREHVDVQVKKAMLQREGVRFDGDRVLDRTYVVDERDEAFRAPLDVEAEGSEART